MEMNKTGRLIEQMRKEKNMTQADLADAVGVSKQAVSNWERGKRFPDVTLIEDLSRVLGVSPAEIIRGERAPESSVSAPEVTQLVFEALSVQRKELNRRWRLIALMLVALTAMLCLGWGYSFFLDRFILLNFDLRNLPPLLIAAVFGCAVRYFSADKETFYRYSLTAMTVWIVCEAFAAIGFKNEAVAEVAFGLVYACAVAAIYILCGLIGAWLTHCVLLLVKRKKK